MEPTLGSPYVVVSVKVVNTADRKFLDYDVHYHPEEGDVVFEMKEDDKVVGYTYFIYHVQNLASATFIVDAIQCLAFRGYNINAHVAYEDREKLVKPVKRGGRGGRRGRGRGGAEVRMY